jgi:hypothetical protein
MIKQLTYTLLTLSIISFNSLPAQALSETKGKELELKVATANNTQAGDTWCVYFPWVGNLCWPLS